jgi:flagella basal body P-ring formation protein FlgA
MDISGNRGFGSTRWVSRVAAAWIWFAPFALQTAGASAVAADAAPAAAPQTIRLLLDRETAGIDGRVEIVFGQLDPRLTLAPCSRIEPFLPAGTKAWGRIHVGMRCRDGAAWTVFLPVNVKVFGTALAARRPLKSGEAPADNDVEPFESELSREPGLPVSDLKQVSGRILARALIPGQVLRMEHFRFAPAVSQGDQVKLVALGTGFSISADGEALAHALDGQSVRVKTETGRIVSGTARPGRIVELKF